MHKILLVEDDAILAHELSAFLSQNGFRVDNAQAGCEVSLMMNSEAYTLCLLDVGLPDCSGFDLCRSIREKYIIPIIMLTAYDDEEDIVKGLELGADDYVTKPYSLRILLSRIHAQIRRIEKETNVPPNVLKSGDLEIDLEHKTVFLKGHELSISGTEFDLCAALAMSDCRIMPRNKLLESVWDSKGKFVDDNTLSVQVSRLRRKLGLFGDTPYIDTVKGIGYRWNIGVHKDK